MLRMQPEWCVTAPTYTPHRSRSFPHVLHAGRAAHAPRRCHHVEICPALLCALLDSRTPNTERCIVLCDPRSPRASRGLYPPTVYPTSQVLLVMDIAQACLGPGSSRVLIYLHVTAEAEPRRPPGVPPPVPTPLTPRPAMPYTQRRKHGPHSPTAVTEPPQPTTLVAETNSTQGGRAGENLHSPSSQASYATSKRGTTTAIQ